MIEIPSKHISKLDLSGHKLSRFPKEVFSLKNLRKLNLSNNEIHAVPKEIEKLKNLQVLDLSNNEITNFQAKICSLRKLETLNLNNNLIKTIPKQIENLSNLRNLQLANNRLALLPKQFEKLGKLVELNISKNPISTFPIEIIKNKNIQSLWINYLTLKDFPALLIQENLKKLRGLYCYGNILDKNLVDSKLYHLSRIRGNCFPEFIRLVESFKQEQVLSKDVELEYKTKMNKNKIFISYSHKDKSWLELIQTNLKALKYNDYDFNVWDDTMIHSGAKWREEIDNALKSSDIAILIISTDFLASDFIRNNELPTILKNANENGTQIFPLIVRPCIYTLDKNLSIFQAVNDPSKPLSNLSESEAELEVVNMTKKISALLI